MYLTVGHFRFREDGVKRAREIMDNIVELGRQEEGIHQYTFYSSPDEDNAFFLFEQWDSKESHDKHFESGKMQAMVPEFFELLDGPPAVSYFDASLSATL